MHSMSMHGMGMHVIGMHDVSMLNVGMHSVGLHHVGVQNVNKAAVGVTTQHFSSAVKIIINKPTVNTTCPFLAIISRWIAYAC
jgi:hypothetical protein